MGEAEGERERLLKDHLKKVIESPIFHNQQNASDVLSYLVDNEAVFPTLESRRREGRIARDVLGLEIDKKTEHLGSENARVRNVITTLRGLLEEYNDAHPEDIV